MSTAPIQISSLDFLKRQANAIKKAEGLKHVRALDVAAQRAGFQNYTHALRQLAPNSRVPRPHALTLSVIWSDRETRERGVETLVAHFSKPLADIVTPAQMAYVRYLQGFTMRVGRDSYKNRQFRF